MAQLQDITWSWDQLSPWFIVQYKDWTCHDTTWYTWLLQTVKIESQSELVQHMSTPENPIFHLKSRGLVPILEITPVTAQKSFFLGKIITVVEARKKKKYIMKVFRYRVTFCDPYRCTTLLLLVGTCIWETTEKFETAISPNWKLRNGDLVWRDDCKVWEISYKALSNMKTNSINIRCLYPLLPTNTTYFFGPAFHDFNILLFKGACYEYIPEIHLWVCLIDWSSTNRFGFLTKHYQKESRWDRIIATFQASIIIKRLNTGVIPTLPQLSFFALFMEYARDNKT